MCDDKRSSKEQLQNSKTNKGYYLDHKYPLKIVEEGRDYAQKIGIVLLQCCGDRLSCVLLVNDRLAFT
jgi:hypothetical protein